MLKQSGIRQERQEKALCDLWWFYYLWVKKRHFEMLKEKNNMSLEQRLLAKAQGSR